MALALLLCMKASRGQDSRLAPLAFAGLSLAGRGRVAWRALGVVSLGDGRWTALGGSLVGAGVWALWLGARGRCPSPEACFP